MGKLSSACDPNPIVGFFLTEYPRTNLTKTMGLIELIKLQKRRLARRCVMRTGSRSPYSRRQRYRRLAVFEILERRELLTIVNWIGGSGDWNTGANWSNGVGPAADDDVVIDVAGADLTINYSEGTHTVASITMAEAVSLTGGTLIVSNQIAGSGVLSIAGGTLQDATVGVTPAVVGTSGNLRHVTLNSNLDLTSGSARIFISDGLTLNGNVSIDYGAMFFDGTQTLSGNGSVIMTGYLSALVINQDNSTLTVGPNITIRGGSTYQDLFYGAVIGRSDAWGGATTDASLVLQGKLSADVADQSLIVRTSAPFNNSGTLEAKNGGHLVVNNLQGNVGTVAPLVGSSMSLDGSYIVDQNLNSSANSNLTLGGTWANTATIATSNSSLNIGGTVTTAGLGSIQRNGGTVNLTGVLDNTNSTLQLDNYGSWRVVGGTIRNGTVSSTGSGSKLIGSDSGGTLEGVSLNSDLDLTSGSTRIFISNGLTLNGDASIDYGAIFFDGTQTLSGNGSVIMTGYLSALVINQDNSTLTVGPNITIRGGSTYQDLTYGAVIGSSNAWGGATTDAGLMLQGKLSADVANQTLIVRTSGPFNNSGTLEAKNGGRLNVQATSLTNFSNGRLVGGTWQAIANGVLSVNHSQAITTNEATILLDGSNASFLQGSSSVSALSTLAVNAPTGSLTLSNGNRLQVANGFTNQGQLFVGTQSELTLSQRAETNFPTSGLVGLWHADGDTTDSSGNENSGTINNGDIFGAGIADQAFQFNGTSYISVASNPTLNWTGAMTIAGWVYLSNNNNNNGIVFKGPLTGSQGVYSLGFYTGYSNRLTFRLNGSTSEGDGQVTGNTDLTPGRWYHIAAVYDQSSQKIFVNGQLDASRTYTSPIQTNTSDLVIGGYYSSGYLLSGSVDELAVYSRALAPIELASLIKSGTFTQTAGNTTLQAGTLGQSNPTPSQVALDFDGNNDVVAIADSPSIRLSDLTMQGWVNFSSLSNASGVLSIFAKPLGSSYFDSYTIYYQNGSLRGGLADNNGFDFVSYNWTPALNVLRSNPLYSAG